MKVALALVVLLCLADRAQAKSHDYANPWEPQVYSYEPQKRVVKRKKVVKKESVKKTRATQVTEVQLLPHPAGCPSRLFCGCGAAAEVYKQITGIVDGINLRELWVAANWFRFPRTEPAPGMVAVRRHHVFVIREVKGPGLVLAYDANSGGRRTRIHLRSLAGYTVVNPRGSRYASVGG